MRPGPGLRLPLTASTLVLAALLAAPAEAAGAEGLWLVEDGTGVIEITACGESVCGRIVGMRQPIGPNGSVPTDTHGTPMCGLSILEAVPDGPAHWSGHIVNPETGTAWNCTLRLSPSGNLLLRGYVMLPLFGQTQTWTHYGGGIGENCAMSR